MISNSSTIWRRSAFSLTLLLILAVLFSVFPAGIAAAAKKETCDKNYEVRRGDTLEIISERFGYAPNQIVYVNGWNTPYTIYVGQKICIPTSVNKEAPKIASKYIYLPAAIFTAGRTANYVSIYPYNYPKTNVVVKVGDARYPSSTYETIGNFKIGNGKTWYFKLPSSLKNVSKLYICLKDMTTSYVQCAVPRKGS